MDRGLKKLLFERTKSFEWEIVPHSLRRVCGFILFFYNALIFIR